MQVIKQINSRGARRFHMIALSVFVAVLFAAFLALAGCSEGSPSTSSASDDIASTSEAPSVGADAPDSLYVGTWNAEGMLTGAENPQLVPSDEVSVTGQMSIDADGYGKLEMSIDGDPFQGSFVLQEDSNVYNLLDYQGTPFGFIRAMQGDSSGPDMLMFVFGTGDKALAFMFTK